MTDTEQLAFDLGVKAGLQAAINLVANLAHCEHDRYREAFDSFDDDTTHEALIRHNFATDIGLHLGEIDPNNINGRYPTPETVMEFNPHSDLSFELGVEIHYCTVCGSDIDVEYIADHYASEIHGDETEDWMCCHCAKNSADDI